MLRSHVFDSIDILPFQVPAPGEVGPVRGVVPAVEAGVERALATVGLKARMAVPAGHLSHGEQRQLEIAMCLATRPRVLILDEPLAGMGTEESAAMVDLLRAIAADHAVLLVEHDMDAVFALARVLTVMVNGVVLDTGDPQKVRANPAVQSAYLGRPEDHA